MTSLQHLLGSGFTAAATAAVALAGVDLTGPTAVVTGGYSGIGVETVRAGRARRGGARRARPAGPRFDRRVHARLRRERPAGAFACGVRPYSVDPAAERLVGLSTALTGVSLS